MEYNSRTVQIGNLLLGGNQPIRIQSMTNTNTLDTKATVEQSVRMIEAGCEMVRITAPGLREAANLGVIKKELNHRGYFVPLIADIHFNPTAAELAARFVEKIRINPGNYFENKTSVQAFYTDSQYNEELEKIASRLISLLSICGEHGTAIRIGTNHGSLSQRIVSRYGDTPEGMVQSALEFTRICHDQGFHKLVLSMKSSNVRVMVAAYRLLAERLKEEGLNYPLHLGVTEAGDGDDGRLKSISGIGALLARRIGDTIRVSLTEDPESEIPVAKSIVDRFQKTDSSGSIFRCIRPDIAITDGNEISKREIEPSGPLDKNHLPAIIVKKENTYYLADENGDTRILPHVQIDKGIVDKNPDKLKFLVADEAMIKSELSEVTDLLKADGKIIVIGEAGSTILRKLSDQMHRKQLVNLLILKSPVNLFDTGNFLIENSLNPGNLLLDGIGNGICLNADYLPFDEVVRIGFGLLQATRMRITRTEFIACPSCGRTLFNIQETLQNIKALTGHLKGLKIGVMGCIVNGPGEMADADYGYVGSGNGKVTLYKGKEPVRKGIPESEAVDALIQLIKEGGDWKDS